MTAIPDASIRLPFFLIALGVGGVLVGCAAVGPVYETPPVDVAEAWQEADAPSLTQAPSAEPDTENEGAWWAAFNDPVLSELIDLASRDNVSIQSAAARILEARAQLGIAVGNLYPQQQQAFGSLVHTSSSHNDANSALRDLSYTQAGLGLDVAWEVDLWGKLRRGVESADAGFLASIAAYDDLMVTLVAEVANAYTVVRTFERRIAIAEENVGIQERSIQIADVRFRNETTTELDVQQAKALLANTQASIPRLEIGLRQTKNALAVLLGVAPGALGETLSQSAAIPTVPADVAIGVPRDLLRRRPDVRQAELEAAAQAARVGVAKAELYPRFALAGSVGVMASDGTGTTRTGESGLGELLTSDSTFATGGGSLVWPLFNYGQLRNQVRVEDARYQQLLLQYQDTVLRAAREAEDAMVAFVRSQDERGFREQSETSARRAVDLALTQYREGATDYTTVLTTQENLVDAQDRLVFVQGDVARSLVALYKALGGGWQIREGRDLLPASLNEEMRQRTNWGGLTTPAMDRPLTPPTEPSLRPDW